MLSIECLKTGIDSHEALLISGLHAELNQLQINSNQLSTEQWIQGLHSMAPFRLNASGTLKKGDYSDWQKANHYVEERLQKSFLPTWQDILNINALLLGNEDGALRNCEIYTGPFRACPLAQLSNSVIFFIENILSNPKELDPTSYAALCQYWLVSLHPFEDANGRTAVLLADWILLHSGYLAMSFASKTDAIIANFSNHRHKATAGNAIVKLLKNVIRSYEIILECDQSFNTRSHAING